MNSGEVKITVDANDFHREVERITALIPKPRPMNFIARQKLRFDMGLGWLSVLNFTLIVVAASDKLAQVVHLKTLEFVLLLVPAAVASVWLLGWLLDKAGFQHAYQAEQNARNDMLKKIALQQQQENWNQVAGQNTGAEEEI